MTRRRKNQLKKVEPKKLDSQVVLFAHTQTDESKNSWHRWRYRTVTYRSAQQLVADGEAFIVEREHQGKKLIMYREKQPLKPSRPSPCTLTRATSEAAAKREHEHRTQAELAHIEKLIMWPFEGAQNPAGIIRPRVGEREVKQMRSLIRRAQGVRATGREFRTKARTQAAHFPEMAPAA